MWDAFSHVRIVSTEKNETLTPALIVSHHKPDFFKACNTHEASLSES